MKLLFVNSSLTDGGSERVMTLLANEFASRGDDVSMLLVRENKKKSYYLDERVNCIQLTYGNAGKAAKYFKRISQIRKYVKEINPDVVISFLLDVNMATLTACRGLSKKVIVSERNNPRANTSSKIRKLMRLYGNNIGYKKAYRVVFQTEQVKEFFNDSIQKISAVIPNPINPEIPEPFNGEREKVIVAVGRLQKQKNFPMTLRAFSRLGDDFKDYKLVIYGEGYMRDELNALSKELGIEDRFEMPGYVTDVNERMKKATMYISSSDYEGISNTMIEALALGLPCICTDCPVGGTAMVIEHNVNGVIIPVQDEDRLVLEMEKLLSSNELREKLSENAANVRNTYSIKSIADMWADLME